MDIIEFFEHSAGKWFSQRTLHNLTSGKLQAGKSELKIEILSASDPAVIKVCSEHSIAPTLATLAGIRVTWNVVADPNQKNGSTVLVPIPNSDNPKVGKLLKSADSYPKNALGKPTVGFVTTYIIGEDDVLTLIGESEDFYATERLWYLMPNLRIRTSVVKESSGMTVASFCSEIRMGVSKPATETAVET
ncbi:chorismate-binding protein [Oscillatoriales cyanobacterium USR001]|nr:chorismate-binding protein [Oscillatoriales cyanobacterium USR001]